MTPEEAAIRERDAATWPSVLNPDPQPPNPEWDRHDLIALLDAERAEVERLTDALADEGYRDGIRLAEAVNEVVAHKRGSIEEAWRYGDSQREIVMKQQRELLTALAEVDRLTAMSHWDAAHGRAAERARIRERVEGLRLVGTRPVVLAWNRAIDEAVAAIDGGEA